jgi:YidC/Oxa1 family membrane protein insertase
MPILLALYNAIMYNKEIATHDFLYLELGKPDPYYILPLLAAFTTYLTFVSSMSTQPQQNQMKAFTWFMPIMVFVLAYNFPAALSLYWVYGNIISILQQVLIFNPMKEKTKVAQRGATR